MTPDFPFRDGQRFTVDDDQFHVHTVMCRRTPAKTAAGKEGAAAGLTLVTAGGYPVVYLPDSGRFRIPVLGCYADRRTRPCPPATAPTAFTAPAPVMIRGPVASAAERVTTFLRRR